MENREMKIICYSNRVSNFEMLANILFKVGQGNEQRLVKIDDNVFYKFFKISKVADNP
jgi:hypothetical protein